MVWVYGFYNAQILTCRKFRKDIDERIPIYHQEVASDGRFIDDPVRRLWCYCCSWDNDQLKEVKDFGNFETSHQRSTAMVKRAPLPLTDSPQEEKNVR
jgi:hypothetical protein